MNPFPAGTTDLKDLYLTGGFSGSSSVPKGIEFTIAKLWDDTYKTDPAFGEQNSRKW